jgi:phosphocarrier protein HPr
VSVPPPDAGGEAPFTERRTVVIVNTRGLHARPAAAIAKLAETFDAEIVFVLGADQVSARSIMGLMTLAAAKGTEIELRARGPDAPTAIDAIAKLVADGFGEDD